MAGKKAKRVKRRDHGSDVIVLYEGPGRRFELHKGCDAKGKNCWYAVEMIADDGPHHEVHDVVLTRSRSHALELAHGWIRHRR